MIKIGMLIADRYEVLEKVGTGGMSDVYKAKDHRLNRMVAVKVLKQEFSENATFVSKFRVEAQAAAGLMHPNIVNVYDVGEEKGAHYIIMELVNGITLKRYIETKGKLESREAVTVAIQVAMGLAAAHRGHIIHRDIKPQNIIISKEGKVKVTDFGIAKASTSNTITSNVMGSVHYTSPEQARGGFSDEKSDVYSLGVTLFEMLTGRVPYEGDSTVAIALQHIQDPFPSPRDFVPDLPVSVEQIVLKCCEKSPDLRYQTMDELVADLRRSMNEPDVDFVRRGDDRMLDKTIPMSKLEQEEIRRKAAAGGAVSAGRPQGNNAAGTEAGKNTGAEFPRDLSRAGNTPGENLASAGGTGGRETLKEEAGTDPESEYYDEEEELEEARRLDSLVRILSVIAVAVVAIIIVLVILSRKGNSAGDEERSDQVAAVVETEEPVENTEEEQEEPEEETAAMVLMPRVVGRTENDARSILSQADLDPEVEYAVSDAYEEGIVIEADYAEGVRLERGTKVTLTVAQTERVEVPDVTGEMKEDAERILQDKRLRVIVREEYDDESEAGEVIDQDPGEDTSVPVNTEVTITVSLGPDRTGMVQVPNLLGMTQQEASAELLRVGLKTGEIVVTDNSGRYTAGTVIGQSVEKDIYVEESTAIDLEISGDPMYSYSARIEAPRQSEDPDYVPGTRVTITIETDDGEVIWNKTTTEFPCSVSISGISCSSGMLYMSYTNIVRDDSSSGATSSAAEPVTREEPQEIVREVTFSRE